jgi:hypothetical protein
MTQDELITPQQLYRALLPNLPPFSLTGHIGGKLCALYQDDAEPAPARISELLGALDREEVAAPPNVPASITVP